MVPLESDFDFFLDLPNLLLIGRYLVDLVLVFSQLFKLPLNVLHVVELFLPPFSHSIVLLMGEASRFVVSHEHRGSSLATKVLHCNDALGFSRHLCLGLEAKTIQC